MGGQAPTEENGFLQEHAALLVESYRRWTGQDLIDPALKGRERGQALFEAPFAVVSHATQQDPIFNYGNPTALRLFEMTWDEFTQLPSRMSAEPVHRDERQRLMDEVSRNGFIANYRGIRISKNGQRFLIEQAVVWNLIDETGNYRGQAAAFREWRFLESYHLSPGKGW